VSAIYLRHPQHGEKVATSEGEASYDQGNGWVRFTPGLPVAAPFVAHIDDKTNEASGAAIVKRRGGRPRKVT
jgi:hypothetical protein